MGDKHETEFGERNGVLDDLFEHELGLGEELAEEDDTNASIAETDSVDEEECEGVSDVSPPP